MTSSLQMLPCSVATTSSQRRTSGSSPCSRTKPGRARRAYGNSTSFTNEMLLVVPSMSVRMVETGMGFFWFAVERSLLRCAFHG
ncbi:hypothetical protein D9M69_730250 [compost metagenome]